MPKRTLIQEFLKARGFPGLIAVVLWVFSSPKSEEKKDARIQILENQT
jgi:hypothetical protein